MTFFERPPIEQPLYLESDGPVPHKGKFTVLKNDLTAGEHLCNLKDLR
jgi:hypothetical protein